MDDAKGRGERWATAGVAAALLVAVAAVYAPVRHHEYVDLDDLARLVTNPDMRPGSLGEALAIAFGKAQDSGWVPITTLSHQLDHWLWGPVDATGPLLTNVALHGLASLLLLLAFRRLTGRLAPSAFVAAVFALHPLHVESVAWAYERKDVLAGLFFAGLLLLYARYAEQPAAPGRHRVLLVCLALGLLSKPTLVTAPCVLLLLDYWPLRRLDRAALIEKWPMLVMVAIVAAVTWRAQGQAGAFDYGAALPLWARVENAVDALRAYLVDAFWPTGLIAYYPHPGSSLSAGRVLATAAGLAALTAAAFALRRRQPWLWVGWLWYGGMLVPMIGLVQVGMQARADRYTYLPLIGISLALAFAVDATLRGAAARRAAAGLGVAAALAMAGLAAAQVHVWRDSYTLYERMRALHPEAAYPELRLGMLKVFERRFAEARPHLERAYALDPALGRQAVPQMLGYAESLAAQGKRGKARRVARWALGFAEQIGETGYEPELEQRLHDWRKRGP